MLWQRKLPNLKTERIIDRAELIVDIILKHLRENECNHNVREAMKEIFQK
jgi:hypothetical protein